ncbi:hypothetical protein BO86DRAFT_210929 [Aspergillus japonicus CBS 114.51]|uniref:Uncharacterized protein n=1 Tax=Aspergillus japonicus CBS 114.51 TaxID=1448312 RepID=A0A8T8XAA5_ASPJA|nr:hypothetical protein BO86DRAFT_210929 [Aspergillus japonicus CBS 114.51]RAH85001.1 hypothetical protein BO86DRAFT_210929 [Aspergillus japonicus CBS 114.51]
MVHLPDLRHLTGDSVLPVLSDGGLAPSGSPMRSGFGLRELGGKFAHEPGTMGTAIVFVPNGKHPLFFDAIISIGYPQAADIEPIRLLCDPENLTFSSIQFNIMTISVDLQGKLGLGRVALCRCSSQNGGSWSCANHHARSQPSQQIPAPRLELVVHVWFSRVELGYLVALEGERDFQHFRFFNNTGKRVFLHLGSIIHVSEGLGARAPPGTVGLGQDPRGLGLLNAWAEGDRRVGIFRFSFFAWGVSAFDVPVVCWYGYYCCLWEGLG